MCKCHAHGIGHAVATEYLPLSRPGDPPRLCAGCFHDGCDADRPLPPSSNVVNVGEVVQGMAVRPKHEVVVGPDDVLVLVSAEPIGPQEARGMMRSLPESLKGRVIVVPPDWTVTVARDILKPR